MLLGVPVDVLHVRLGIGLNLSAVTVTQLEMQLMPFISPQLANAYVRFFLMMIYNIMI